MPASVVDGVDLNPDGDGTLTWAGSGKGFAVIKATQGDYYSDSDFSGNWAALKAAGITRGAYHFFDATVSGVTQANYYLGVIGTLQVGDFPPILDIECPVSGDTDCLGNGSSGAASASQITQAMNDFLTTVKTATGLTPIVYSYGSWFSDNGVDTTGLQNYPLWIADYSGSSCFNVPSPWTVATLWQYDSSGTVDGVNVDDDYFLGTAAQLAAFNATGSLPVDGGVESDSGMDYGTCTVSATGDMGLCIDTTQCANEGGSSTPDFCPGPANIQCCTGIKVTDAGTDGGSDAGKPSDSGAADATTEASALDGAVEHDGGEAEDGGKDAGAPDGGERTPTAAEHAKAGCSCELAGGSSSPLPTLLGLPLLALLAVLRRRRSGGSSAQA